MIIHRSILLLSLFTVTYCNYIRPQLTVPGTRWDGIESSSNLQGTFSRPDVTYNADGRPIIGGNYYGTKSEKQYKYTSLLGSIYNKYFKNDEMHRRADLDAGRSKDGAILENTAKKANIDDKKDEIEKGPKMSTTAATKSHHTFFTSSSNVITGSCTYVNIDGKTITIMYRKKFGKTRYVRIMPHMAISHSMVEKKKLLETCLGNAEGAKRSDNSEKSGSEVNKKIKDTVRKPGPNRAEALRKRYQGLKKKLVDAINKDQKDKDKVRYEEFAIDGDVNQEIEESEVKLKSQTLSKDDTTRIKPGTNSQVAYREKGPGNGRGTCKYTNALNNPIKIIYDKKHDVITWIQTKPYRIVEDSEMLLDYCLSIENRRLNAEIGEQGSVKIPLIEETNRKNMDDEPNKKNPNEDETDTQGIQVTTNDESDQKNKDNEPNKVPPSTDDETDTQSLKTIPLDGTNEDDESNSVSTNDETDTQGLKTIPLDGTNEDDETDSVSTDDETDKQGLKTIPLDETNEDDEPNSVSTNDESDSQGEEKPLEQINTDDPNSLIKKSPLKDDDDRQGEKLENLQTEEDSNVNLCPANPVLDVVFSKDVVIKRCMFIHGVDKFGDERKVEILYVEGPEPQNILSIPRDLKKDKQNILKKCFEEVNMLSEVCRQNMMVQDGNKVGKIGTEDRDIKDGSKNAQVEDTISVFSEILSTSEDEDDVEGDNVEKFTNLENVDSEDNEENVEKVQNIDNAANLKNVGNVNKDNDELDEVGNIDSVANQKNVENINEGNDELDEVGNRDSVANLKNVENVNKGNDEFDEDGFPKGMKYSQRYQYLLKINKRNKSSNKRKPDPAKTERTQITRATAPYKTRSPSNVHSFRPSASSENVEFSNINGKIRAGYVPPGYPNLRYPNPRYPNTGYPNPGHPKRDESNYGSHSVIRPYETNPLGFRPNVMIPQKGETFGAYLLRRFFNVDL